MSGNSALIQSAYAAFARGDVPTVLSIFDPKIEWTECAGYPYAGTYHGPDAIVSGVFFRLGTEWESYQVLPREFLDAGEKVVVLGTYTGTYKATGKAFTAEFAHVWTIRNGKAVKFVQYADTVPIAAALER